MEDEVLAKLCQEGQLENFAHLYDRYLPKIYGYIYYRTKHKETAEDLTSTIFGKALGQIKKFDSAKGTFSAWLYRIARNSLIDEKRGERITLNIDDVEVPSAVDQQELANQRFRLKKAEQYLESLSSEQREVILLRIWDDLPYKEIASIMNKNEASCKMLFSRAIARLRADGSLALLLLLILHGYGK